MALIKNDNYVFFTCAHRLITAAQRPWELKETDHGRTTKAVRRRRTNSAHRSRGGGARGTQAARALSRRAHRRRPEMVRACRPPAPPVPAIGSQRPAAGLRPGQRTMEIITRELPRHEL